MKAITIKRFDGARDGDIHPTTFSPGDIVEGDLARVALLNSWAEPAGAAVAIPGNWEKLKAADKIALARALGAPQEVDTGSEAAAFIRAEAGKRAGQ